MTFIKTIFFGAAAVCILILIIMMLPTLIGVMWIETGILAIIIIPLWWIGCVIRCFTGSKKKEG